MSDIAVGAREQSTALEEINLAIDQMNMVTQQNAAMVEESTAAGHSLSEETSKLSQLMGQFQVGRAVAEATLRAELAKTAPHAFRPPAKATSPAAAARAKRAVAAAGGALRPRAGRNSESEPALAARSPPPGLLRRRGRRRRVIEDRRQPALDFGDRHALARRVVLDLIALDPSRRRNNARPGGRDRSR